jgi:hypothetical protein
MAAAKVGLMLVLSNVQKLLLLAQYCNQGSVLLADAFFQAEQPLKALAYLKVSLLMSQAKFLLAWLLKCLWVQHQRHQPFLLVRLLA